MNADQLLKHFHRVGDATDAIPRLRRFVLDLAVRGKLVPQDPSDEPASELLKRIEKEKARLVKVGESKKAEPIAALASSRPMLSPHGWAITNLQSVCASITDGDHLPPPKAESGIPFLVIGNVRSQRINFAGSRFVPPEYYEALDPIRRPRSGDLLYTLVGSYGIPVIVRDDQPFCVQRHIGILRPTKLIDVSFLARAMESRLAFDQATACATGIAQKTVPLSELRKLSIPLPPLAEQHRIVAKVDALMALCDRVEAARAGREATRDRLAAASLARLNAPDPDTFKDDVHLALATLPALITRPDQIKQLRQTILNLAVRGKLVPQNPNDEPASELLNRIAKEKARLVKAGEVRRDQPLPMVDQDDFPMSAPIGWALTRLAAISRRIHYGFTASADANLKDVRMLRITDIQDNAVDWSSVPGCVIDGDNVEQYKLKKGDILIARTGGTIGKTFLIRDVSVTAVFASYLIRIQGTNYVFDEYLKLFLESPLYWTQLRDGTRGTGQPNVNGQTLGIMILPLPPLAEQHRIVTRVDALMALCDRLEASLDHSAAARRRLLDALLAEALAPINQRDAA